MSSDLHSSHSSTVQMPSKVDAACFCGMGARARVQFACRVSAFDASDALSTMPRPAAIPSVRRRPHLLPCSPSRLWLCSSPLPIRSPSRSFSIKKSKEKERAQINAPIQVIWIGPCVCAVQVDPTLRPVWAQQGEEGQNTLA